MGFTGNEVALEFAQVGDDAKATDFLTQPSLCGF